MKNSVSRYLVDVVLIVVFTMLGRQTHEHGLSILGIAQTAAPFLLAYFLISVVARFAWPRRVGGIWPDAVLTWLVTAGLGLVFRVLFGATAAPAFQIVTFVTLGLFLVAHAAIRALISRKSRRTGLSSK
ncbi:hypothetical protein HD598_000603 [Neomicrococcus aestuarii]|uniref:DUF3054 domain-containing protein n=1 Tax=Neomicrococcus aestuarii TaxID=556325 RepID=A0A7W8TS50_9MICC|nr:DUF3054 domain-containing protein [Neomicrococcus aestuarii]MBB5511916.1 hypothetical protein [Neomicrococcus aestuarii]